MSEIKAKREDLGGGVVRITWAALAGGDTGGPVYISQFADRTVQATGDGTNVAIHGSNTSTSFGVALADAGGTVIALDPATNEMALIRENPLLIWPVVTGGASTTIIIVGVTDK